MANSHALPSTPLADAQIPGLGFVADTLKTFLEWVEDNPGLGAVAFAAVYIFTTVCFIPGSLLTLGAGLVFGRALGTGLGVLVGSVAVLVRVPTGQGSRSFSFGCSSCWARDHCNTPLIFRSSNKCFMFHRVPLLGTTLLVSCLYIIAVLQSIMHTGYVCIQ